MTMWTQWQAPQKTGDCRTLLLAKEQDNSKISSSDPMILFWNIHTFWYQISHLQASLTTIQFHWQQELDFRLAAVRTERKNSFPSSHSSATELRAAPGPTYDDWTGYGSFCKVPVKACIPDTGLTENKLLHWRSVTHLLAFLLLHQSCQSWYCPQLPTLPPHCLFSCFHWIGLPIHSFLHSLCHGIFCSTSWHWGPLFQSQVEISLRQTRNPTTPVSVLLPTGRSWSHLPHHNLLLHLQS